MNNKSIFERLNSIKNRGPERWLSRSLREEDHLSKGRRDSQELSRNLTKASEKKLDPERVPTDREMQTIVRINKAGERNIDPTTGQAKVASSPPPAPPKATTGRGSQVPSSSSGVTPISGDRTRPPSSEGSENETNNYASRTDKIIENLKQQLRGATFRGAPKKDAQSILDRLEHDIAGPRMKKFISKMLETDSNLRTKFPQINRFSDKEGALRFLTEGMGLVNDNGTLRAGDPNRELRSLAGAGMPGEGRGEPRGIGFREVQALMDENRKRLLLDATRDESGEGAKLLHRNALKNNISWELATKLYDMMDADLQNKLNVWGKPEGAQGTFTPKGPVEFLIDENGQFTGETNIDALRRQGEEGMKKYLENFDNNTGNRGRGIFGLMKHLAQGGEGEFSGQLLPFDFDGVTPDHIGGRSSGELPGGRKKDDPLNLAFDRRGLNQFKVSSGNKKLRTNDTIPSMLESAGKVKTVLGDLGIDEEDFENLEDSPNFMKYLAYKLSQTEFDPDVIAKRGGDRGFDSYPDTIVDFLEQDEDGNFKFNDEMLKALQSKSAKGNNPLGLNIRNMAMRAPRTTEYMENNPAITENTWGGHPGGGNEYHPIVGYRRAMAAAALYDPNTKKLLQEFEDSIGPRVNEDKRAEKIAARRRKLAEEYIFRPQKAIGTLFGMGRLNNEQYIKALQDLATKKIGFLKESNPDQHKTLMDGLTKSLGDYRTELDNKFGQGPHRIEDETLRPLLDSSYMRAILGSNYGRSVMPELISDFDKIPANEKVIGDKLSESGLQLNVNVVL